MPDISPPFWAEWLVELRPYLKRVATLRMTSSVRQSCASSDIAQDAIVKVIQNAGDCRGKSRASFFGWSAEILRNLIHDIRRAKNRRKERSFEGSSQLSVDEIRGGIADWLDADAPTPSQLASDKELKRRLGDAILQLDEKYRSALLLRMDGLTREQIAERLGVGSGVAANRLRTAVHRLSHALCDTNAE